MPRWPDVICILRGYDALVFDRAEGAAAVVEDNAECGPVVTGEPRGMSKRAAVHTDNVSCRK